MATPLALPCPNCCRSIDRAEADLPCPACGFWQEPACPTTLPLVAHNSGAESRADVRLVAAVGFLI
jgi:hypothetical protein